MNKTIYEEAIYTQTNAERWQAELIADIAIRVGDTLEEALETALAILGPRTVA